MAKSTGRWIAEMKATHFPLRVESSLYTEAQAQFSHGFPDSHTAFFQFTLFLLF